MQVVTMVGAWVSVAVVIVVVVVLVVVVVTPERYLFSGSTRYYTIFWVFIRYTILSHDICNMSDFVKNARKLQEMRH